MEKLQEVKDGMLSDTMSAAIVNLAVVGQASSPGAVAEDYGQRAIDAAPEEGTGQLVQRACDFIIEDFGWIKK